MSNLIETKLSQHKTIPTQSQWGQIGVFFSHVIPPALLSLIIIHTFFVPYIALKNASYHGLIIGWIIAQIIITNPKQRFFMSFFIGLGESLIMIYVNETADTKLDFSAVLVATFAFMAAFNLSYFIVSYLMSLRSQ